MFSPFKFNILLCLVLYCFSMSIHAQEDLEEIAQDFVLETKKITIAEFPYAFNPSITKWKGRWLMSFRVIKNPQQVDEVSSATESEIGLVWLDNKFHPIGSPQFLVLDHPDKKRPFLLAEDARLIANGDRLYIIYSANKEAEITDAGFRVYVTQLENDDKGFYVVHNECLSSFEGANPYKREKNWVPFIYHNHLLLAYQLFPHKIFRPLLDGSEYCETIATSIPSIIWEWGELRGGTPAFQLNEEFYLAFFHSVTLLRTLHSNGQPMPHYFIGAYLFSSAPPFKIKYISPEPIIGTSFYHGPVYKPYWHPVRVVFPCGLIVDENEIWIFYGRQDHEIWIAKLDKQGLINSFIHVSTILE